MQPECELPLLSNDGTYTLILESRVERLVRIGRLGTMTTHKGFYVYVGSALGPGGILARIRHHTDIAQIPHWHTDYLRAVTELIEVWYAYDKDRLECNWANFSQSLSGSSAPLPGFGASDCTCHTHMFFFVEVPGFYVFQGTIHRLLSGACQASAAPYPQIAVERTS